MRKRRNEQAKAGKKPVSKYIHVLKTLQPSIHHQKTFLINYSSSALLSLTPAAKAVLPPYEEPHSCSSNISRAASTFGRVQFGDAVRTISGSHSRAKSGHIPTYDTQLKSSKGNLVRASAPPHTLHPRPNTPSYQHFSCHIPGHTEIGMTRSASKIRAVPYF